MGTKFKVNIGQKFGEWEILEDEATTKGNGYYYYKCKCSCGTIRGVVVSNLKRGISTNCGCVKRKNPAHNYKGLGNLSQKYFNRVRNNAKIRSLEFKVEKEYLLSIFNDKCALTGLEITLNRNPDKQTASLDRIDSSKGYIEGNVQWVHQDINFMKRNYNQEYFIKICKLVANEII